MTDIKTVQALVERDPSKPAEQQGLFRKFIVLRTDGSDQPGGKHHGCEYFVLDVNHDPHAKAALAAYADAVEATHPELAKDMRERYALIAQMQRDAVQPADVLEDQCPNCDPRRFCTRKECAAPQPAPEPQQDQLQQPDGHSTRASGVCASTTPLPCPFCGGEARVLPRTCNKDTPYNAADRAFPVVRCVGCHAEASGKDWSEPATAITAWNRRSAAGAQQQDDHAGSPAPSRVDLPARVVDTVAASVGLSGPFDQDFYDFAQALMMEVLARAPAPSAESSKAALSDDEALRLWNYEASKSGYNSHELPARFARAILARAGIGDSRREPQWQPMETAPKGERILMLMKHGAIEGQWDGETGSGYYWRPMEWYPSHWMPLPEAPKEQA